MKHESYVFVQPIKDPSLITEDFAQRFANFINSSLKDRCLAGDKISIISHSQGGMAFAAKFWKSHTTVHACKPNFCRHQLNLRTQLMLKSI